ncbi:MAG: hypothetical protein ACRENI_12215 [Gemmatimonadaceae bacterium]
MAGQGDSALRPLAGVSGVVTVLCTEIGPWVASEADEHGFTNPPGQWDLPRVDLALIGDSFVEGQCVDPAASFASLIRARYPATIVTGVSAAGPLVELGFLREYVARLKPRFLFWFYYEGNDLTDLEAEKRMPLILRYLEPGFSQGLALRQAEVDARLKAIATAAESIAVQQRATLQAGPSLRWRVLASMKLWHLRTMIRDRLSVPDVACCDMALLARVLTRAAEDVRGWGGNVVVVYLPAQATLAGGRAARQLPANAVDSVRAVVRKLGLPLLDLRDTLRNYGPVDSLFPYETAHLTERGQQIVAGIILRYLAGRDSLFASCVPDIESNPDAVRARPRPLQRRRRPERELPPCAAPPAFTVARPAAAPR